MGKWWDMPAAIGEMFGSMLLTLAVILSALVVKKNEKTLNTPLKKRLLTAGIVGSAVVAGIVTARGFGGHGQINPAITLMISIKEQLFAAIPMIIGFQLIGALAAALIGLIVVKVWKGAPKMTEVFKFSEQTVQKTISIEGLANVFWLLPVAALVFNANASWNIFEIALAAAIGLMVIIIAS